MKKSCLKIRYIIVALGLAIIGIVLLSISEYVHNSIINNLISEIGSAILISGIFGIIDEYVLKEGLTELILEKIRIKEELNAAGLEELLLGITDINYKCYFKQASKNIDIVHIYGRSWTNDNIDEITERILKTNCKVRVVLMNPQSKFVPALEEHFNYESGKLGTLINDVSKVWKARYEKKLQQKKRVTQGSIKLYYHKGQPTNSIYRIDDRIIVVQTKTTKERTTKMPVLIFKDTNEEECFYNAYLRDIEQIVNESKEIDFNSI